MAKRPLPLGEVYRLIEPGRWVLVSTMNGGRANIMNMSWHMMVDFEPPIIACVMSNRDYSSEALKRTSECVINVPAVELARKVVGCGNTSGSDVDKFKKFGLTASAAFPRIIHHQGKGKFAIDGETIKLPSKMK